jgi:hypothetical protein
MIKVLVYSVTGASWFVVVLSHCVILNLKGKGSLLGPRLLGH